MLVKGQEGKELFVSSAVGKAAAPCAAEGRMWHVGYRRLGNGRKKTCKGMAMLKPGEM